MICPICNQGELKKAKIREEQFGVFLGEYEGLQCMACNESFFDDVTTKKVIEKAKKMGMFGIDAKTKIARSGNSLAVRIPKRIVDFLKLKEGKEVKIHPAGNKLIIENYR